MLLPGYYLGQSASLLSTRGLTRIIAKMPWNAHPLTGHRVRFWVCGDGGEPERHRLSPQAAAGSSSPGPEGLPDHSHVP